MSEFVKVVGAQLVGTLTGLVLAWWSQRRDRASWRAWEAQYLYSQPIANLRPPTMTVGQHD